MFGLIKSRGEDGKRGRGKLEKKRREKQILSIEHTQRIHTSVHFNILHWLYGALRMIKCLHVIQCGESA